MSEEEYTPQQLQECARIASEALQAAAEKLFRPDPHENHEKKARASARTGARAIGRSHQTPLH
jgi:hypothetical protein